MKRIPRSAGSGSDLVKAEADLAALEKQLAWEMSKAAVDVAGLVDPTPISDAVGMGMSLMDGDLIGAGLSLISMVPYAGDALGKTAKGARAAKKLNQLRKQIAAATAKVRALKNAKAAKPAAKKAVRKAGSKPKSSGPCVPCAKKAKKKGGSRKGSKPARNHGIKKITERTQPPNPGGRPGGPAHRAKVKQRAKELEDQGHTIKAGGQRLPERAVKTPEGKVRFPDIETRTPTGKPYYENVGRKNKSGLPVSRERKALKDIERATGKKPGFTHYDP